jgi:hypothetical protein
MQSISLTVFLQILGCSIGVGFIVSALFDLLGGDEDQNEEIPNVTARQAFKKFEYKALFLFLLLWQSAFVSYASTSSESDWPSGSWIKDSAPLSFSVTNNAARDWGHPALARFKKIHTNGLLAKDGNGMVSQFRTARIHGLKKRKERILVPRNDTAGSLVNFGGKCMGRQMWWMR